MSKVWFKKYFQLHKDKWVLIPTVSLGYFHWNYDGTNNFHIAFMFLCFTWKLMWLWAEDE